MNELISKILDIDQLGMLELLDSNPGLLNLLSESKRTPVEVAKATGSVYIYVTLLRYQEHLGFSQNWFNLLKEYVGQISNDWTCASWYNDIEFEIWHSMKGNIFKVSAFEGYTDINPEMKKDLEWLSLKLGGWTTCEAKETVPLIEWEKQYNQWLKDKYA